MDLDELSNRFEYHPPQTDFVKDQHERIRYYCHRLAKIIDVTVPDSREKSLAITKLEEAMMWANAGIARNQAS